MSTELPELVAFSMHTQKQKIETELQDIEDSSALLKKIISGLSLDFINKITKRLQTVLQDITNAEEISKELTDTVVPNVQISTPEVFRETIALGVLKSPSIQTLPSTIREGLILSLCNEIINAFKEEVELILQRPTP